MTDLEKLQAAYAKPFIYKETLISKDRNIAGQQVMLSKTNLGLFNVKINDELMIESRSQKKAEVFFMNCF